MCCTVHHTCKSYLINLELSCQLSSFMLIRNKNEVVVPHLWSRVFISQYSQPSCSVYMNNVKSHHILYCCTHLIYSIFTCVFFSVEGELTHRSAHVSFLATNKVLSRITMQLTQKKNFVRKVLEQSRQDNVHVSRQEAADDKLLIHQLTVVR